jgi:hypothetical protein
MSAISKEIYRSNIEDQYAEEDKMAERYQETMKISSGVSLFLNFNAILLMCVFVLCYALFA